MEFEEKFKNKIRQKEIDRIETVFARNWELFEEIELRSMRDSVYYILKRIECLLKLYNLTVTEEDKKVQFGYDEVKEIIHPIIMELKKRIQLTKSEEYYIKYLQEKEGINIRAKTDGINAILEVLVKRLLSEKIDIPDLTGLDEMIFEKYGNTEIMCEQLINMRKMLDGEILEGELSEIIEKRVEEEFNRAINCAGYALGIDVCIFLKDGNLEKVVSSILETFPFVRLLGDTELEDDEYLVVYTCRGEGFDIGHHFVKRTPEGIYMEKNECGPVREFKEWPQWLKDSQQVFFAVKKEHPWEYFKKGGSIFLPTKNAKNFEETVLQAITDKQNIFEYLNHTYILKKSEDGMIYVCSNDNIIAQVLVEGEEYDIEIEEQYRGYIVNTPPSRRLRGISERQEGDLDER